MEVLKQYLEHYEAEKIALETSNDEDIILQQVAEFEAELRKDFADKKAIKIKETENKILVLKEVLELEEQKKSQETGEKVVEETLESDDSYEVVVEDDDFSFDKTDSEIKDEVDPSNPFSGN